MTETALAHTGIRDSYRAGLFLGEQLAASLQSAPDVVIVFAAPTYEHSVLLEALKEACEPRILLGCSSAGEFTSGSGRRTGVCACSALVGVAVRCGSRAPLTGAGVQAAQELVSSFQGKGNQLCWM